MKKKPSIYQFLKRAKKSKLVTNKSKNIVNKYKNYFITPNKTL